MDDIPKLNYILVGVDGSKYAEAALEKAIELTKKYKVPLNIVHVVDMHRQLYSFPTPGARLKLDEKQKASIQSLLNMYEEKARSMGIENVSTKILLATTHAGAAIVAEAEKNCPVIVVIGTRGIGGISRMVMGSVAEYVSKNSPCDVYIVKS